MRRIRQLPGTGLALLLVQSLLQCLLSFIQASFDILLAVPGLGHTIGRSEEHTSELQSLV